MRGLAAHVSTLCKRFTAVLRRCDGAFYINVGKLFPEIAPMEKRLDLYIDTLRREEFRFFECGNDIQKYVGNQTLLICYVETRYRPRMLGQFEHLAETYFAEFQFDLGERQLDRILSVEHDLDSFMAALALTKHEVMTALNDEGEHRYRLTVYIRLLK
jgi:dynactin 1